MGVADFVIAAAVLAAATGLLWRSMRRGGCPGCSSGGCGRAPAGQDLVRLGRGPRPGGS